MADRSGIPPRVVLVLVVGVISFSASPILIRLAGDEAGGLTIAVWRTVIAASLLAPLAAWRARNEIRALTRRDKRFIALAGVFLGVHFITWIESLYHTSVASATVIVSASPVVLAILGYLLLREKLPWYANVAIGISFVGAAMIGVGDRTDAAFPNANFGNLLSAFSCLMVAAYLLIGRIVRRGTSWLAYVFPLYAVVAMTTLVVGLLRNVTLLGLSPTFYLLCALMAIGPQILGHGSLNYAVGYLPTAIVGLTTLTEPVVASTIAFFLFGEAPTALSAGGMVIILLGVSAVFLPAIVQRERAKNARKEVNRRSSDRAQNNL